MGQAMTYNTRGAVIEIIERTKNPDHDVVVPNDVRINGQSLYCPVDDPIIVHEIRMNGEELVRVTLTLYAKRVIIGHELIE